MSAYEHARYDDLCQRRSKNETLTPREQRELNRLDNLARDEWENSPPPRWLGGDYPDVF